MNANELIDSYVADVARLLGRKQRDDVAFELRALLVEELDAKAEAAGRAPDAALATELLAGFGRPAEVAARYQPALVMIDPADTRTFVRASVIGVAIWWSPGHVCRVRARAARSARSATHSRHSARLVARLGTRRVVVARLPAGLLRCRRLDSAALADDEAPGNRARRSATASIASATSWRSPGW